MAAIAAVALMMGAQAVQTAGQVQALKGSANAAKMNAEADERSYRSDADRLLSKREALAAAGGVDPSSGSPLFDQIDQVKTTELNARTIRAKGQYEESLYKKQIAPTILGGFLSGASSFAAYKAKYGGTSSSSSSSSGGGGGGYISNPPPGSIR